MRPRKYESAILMDLPPGALNFAIVMPDATLILYFADAHGDALYAVCITIFSCISLS
jgi:hypothetical protein